MKIKQILDEIANESSTNKKMEILSKYKDNELLREVLYLAYSKKIKFYLKQIPEYTTQTPFHSLETDLCSLKKIYMRQFTGGEAIEFLRDILSYLDPDDAYVVERIIEKDCKIGMGHTNINKIFKKLIEDTPYMGAQSYDKDLIDKILKRGNGAFSQIKMDGRYCNAIIRSGEVELESRGGEATIVTGAKFLEELKNFKDCVLNGELTMDGVSRYESNGIITSIIDITSKKDERTEEETDKYIKKFEDKHGSFEKSLFSIRYTIWDTIRIAEYFEKSSPIPYDRRLEDVKYMLESAKPTMVSLIKTTVVDSQIAVIAHLQEVLAKGMEGTIIKDPKGEWKDGKPNWQVKAKLEMDVDLKITGFNYGSKGTKNEHLISSFNAESSDGLVKTRPQGLKEDIMKYVTENQDKLLGKILQCRCCGLSHDSEGNYSLLHPSFISIRDDKDTCDTLDSIKKIEEMSKTLS